MFSFLRKKKDNNLFNKYNCLEEISSKKKEEKKTDTTKNHYRERLFCKSNNSFSINEIKSYNDYEKIVEEQKKTLKELQKQNNIQPPFSNEEKKNFKTNSTPMVDIFSFGYESLGLSIKSFFNNFSKDSFGFKRIKKFISLSLKEGPLFPSMFGETLLSWCYSQYPEIDKIIKYHLYKAFSNITFEYEPDNCDYYENIEEQKKYEEENKIKNNLFASFFNKKISKENINKYIIDAIFLAEKFGGSYLCGSDGKFFCYTKFDFEKKFYEEFYNKEGEKKTYILFKDGCYFDVNDVVCLASSKTPTTQMEKNFVKGWGFCWLDKYFNNFSIFLQMRASFNQLISRMQVFFVKNSKNGKSLNNNDYQDYNVLGYGNNGTDSIDKIANLETGDATAGFEGEELVNIQTSAEEINTFLKTQYMFLSSFSSIPVSFFYDDGCYNFRNDDKNNFLKRQEEYEISEIFNHYKTKIELFLIKNLFKRYRKKIIEIYNNIYKKKDIDVIDLSNDLTLKLNINKTTRTDYEANEAQLLKSEAEMLSAKSSEIKLGLTDDKKIDKPSNVTKKIK